MLSSSIYCQELCDLKVWHQTLLGNTLCSFVSVCDNYVPEDYIEGKRTKNMFNYCCCSLLTRQCATLINDTQVGSTHVHDFQILVPLRNPQLKWLIAESD